MFYFRVYLSVVEIKAHLDDGEKALVGGGVSGNWEAPSGVSGNDAVHSTPGLSVRLVFISHRQVSDYDIHPVLVNLPKELTKKVKKRFVNTLKNSLKNRNINTEMLYYFGEETVNKWE